MEQARTTAAAVLTSGNSPTNPVVKLPIHFDDLLPGAKGPDFLQGLSGNDTLQALTGNDLLSGGLSYGDAGCGAGKDFFAFNGSLHEGDLDHIQDHEVVTDRIWIENAAFTERTSGKLQVSAFAANISGNADTALQRIIHRLIPGVCARTATAIGRQCGCISAR